MSKIRIELLTPIDTRHNRFAIDICPARFCWKYSAIEFDICFVVTDIFFNPKPIESDAPFKTELGLVNQFPQVLFIGLFKILSNAHFDRY